MSERQIVLRAEGKTVLYSPHLNELSVDLNELAIDLEEYETITADEDSEYCKLCHQLLPATHSKQEFKSNYNFPRRLSNSISATHDSSYFTLLSDISRPPTRSSSPILDSAMNSGYYATYFQEIKKLGKGGQGIVFLVRHILNGQELGTYACKRVPVGNSSNNLISMLKEIHLLELLSSHPNIVTYHHSWMEASESTSFTPSIPSLYILMEYCSAGSLEDLIQARNGNVQIEPINKEERIRFFKLRKLIPIHLLNLTEIVSLLQDITTGLAFLHNKGIIHCDLKPENVLLSWEGPDQQIPIAKISDFGSSTSFSTESWNRGKTLSGTISFMAPECWSQKEATRAGDQWSLGLVLHYLCFFTLPYQNSELKKLEIEIQNYPGFFLTDAHHGVRHDLPQSILHLLRRLILRDQSGRLSSEEVLLEIEKIKKEVAEPKIVELNSVVLKTRSFSPPVKPIPLSKPDLKMMVTPPPTSKSLSLPLSRLNIQRLTILVLASTKISSLQLISPLSTLSNRAIYFVLIPSILEAMIMRESASIIGIGFHFIVLGLGFYGLI